MDDQKLDSSGEDSKSVTNEPDILTNPNFRRLDSKPSGNSSLVTQDMVLPSAIKPRHLVSGTTAAAGDMYYSDNTNFKKFTTVSGGILKGGSTPSYISPTAGGILTSSASTPSYLPIGSTGQYLGVTGAVPTWTTNDGWIQDPNTWTYASATSFTITGDQTSTYQGGVKVKLLNSTQKFFLVKNSTVAAGVTTVNLVATSDFTVANSAITSNYYSFSSHPVGWWGFFNYTGLTFTSSGGAFTNPPTLTKSAYQMIDQVIFLYIDYIYDATSGGSGATWISTLPVAPYSALSQQGCGRDNTNTLALIVSASRANNRIEVYKYDGSSVIGNSVTIQLTIGYYFSFT